MLMSRAAAPVAPRAMAKYRSSPDRCCAKEVRGRSLVVGVAGGGSYWPWPGSLMHVVCMWGLVLRLDAAVGPLMKTSLAVCGITVAMAFRAAQMLGCAIMMGASKQAHDELHAVLA